VLAAVALCKTVVLARGGRTAAIPLCSEKQPSAAAVLADFLTALKLLEVLEAAQAETQILQRTNPEVLFKDREIMAAIQVTQELQVT